MEAHMGTAERSVVLTLRVPPGLDRQIERQARKTRTTKSRVLREALERAFADGPPPEDPAREARRQSLLVSRRRSERDALEFIQHAADTRGWR
jgi:predicted transcriptional regulator